MKKRFFSKSGAALLALGIYAVGMAEAAAWPGTVSDFYGFDLYDFTTNGLSCKVAVPDVVADGKPWVWRARFWGHKPAPDIALLGNGFHVAYVDVSDLFGSPAAVGRFDAFYDFLTNDHGFDERAVLEGMSRGGLAIYNWAAQNPDKIHCVYADAPVCDFKSWPAGLYNGVGNAPAWTNCLAAYGFTEAEALAYGGNPVDNMQPLAQAGIPLLHVVGDDDAVVPVAENTAIVAARYEALGGLIDVIHKPNVGHVHGLDDSTPIIDFVLSHMAYIHNQPPSDILGQSATLNGLLSLPEMNYEIQVHWGVTDGGTNAGAWDHSASLGSWVSGDLNQVSQGVGSLSIDTTYHYTFSASNENGRVWDDARETFTTQEDIVTADMVADSLSGQAPCSIGFDASGSTADDGIVSYDWDFGDGNVATGAMVTNVYMTAGSYSVVLTVTDVSNRTAQAVTALEIAAAPTGDVTSSTDVFAVANTNYGTDAVAILYSAAKTAPDALATFRIAVSVDPKAGTSITSGAGGVWGINSGEGASGQWTTFDGSFSEYVDSISNIQIVDFNANGGTLTLDDFSALSFQSVTVVNGNNNADRVKIVAGGVANAAGGLKMASTPAIIDLQALAGSDAVTNFTLANGNLGNNKDRWNVGSIQVEYTIHMPSGESYAVWASGYGLTVSNALQDADVDNGGMGDGYDNLAEFALGMNPTNSDAGSMESVGTAAEDGTNYFEYVHLRHSNYADQGLSYLLIDSTNLVNSTTSTNTQDQMLIGPSVDGYEPVTNRYVADDPVKFIELKIRQE